MASGAGGQGYDRLTDPPPAYSIEDPQKKGPIPGQEATPNMQHIPSPPPSYATMAPPTNQPYNYHTGYGSLIVDQPVTVPVTQVILIGGCPSCRVGVLEDSYSLVGVLCAIVFFPLGVLCCLAMRDKVCTNCGATY